MNPLYEISMNCLFIKLTDYEMRCFRMKSHYFCNEAFEQAALYNLNMLIQSHERVTL